MPIPRYFPYSGLPLLRKRQAIAITTTTRCAAAGGLPSLSKGGAPSRANQLLPAWAQRACPGRVSTRPDWKFCILHTNAVAHCPGASAFRNYRKRRPLFSRELSVYVVLSSLPSLVFSPRSRLPAPAPRGICGAGRVAQKILLMLEKRLASPRPTPTMAAKPRDS